MVCRVSGGGGGSAEVKQRKCCGRQAERRVEETVNKDRSFLGLAARVGQPAERPLPCSQNKEMKLSLLTLI
eukprot:scaffold413_cov176-Ochromonas_danica.AAC.7